MWRATLHSRCAVARASLQLSQLPELAALQPRGLFPPAPSPPARAALHAGLARGLDIVRSLGGGGGGGALEQAALRLCASGAEACGRFAAGGAPAARAAAASAADFDTGGGFARAAAAEASLACARLSLWGVGSSDSGSGSGSAAAADEALSASLAASAGIEEELRHIEGPSDAAAAVALLPNALAHARASALRVLLRALHKGSSAGAAAGSAAAAAAAAASEEDEGGPAASLALALNACGSVEDVLRRALPSEASAPAAAAPRYLHLRAQAARALAHQNMASAHLFAAAPLLLPGQRAAELAPRAQSLLTAAHTQLTEALGVVEGALRGAEEGATAAAAAAAAAASTAAAAAAPAPPPASQSEAWARLQWDLRASRGELLAARSEAALLGALCLLWASGGGCGHPVSAAAAPPGPLFPLSQAEAAMAAPVLRGAWEGAMASLRCYEAAEEGSSSSAGGSEGRPGGGAAAAAAAAALQPIYCERGLDAGLGAARALRVLAVLNCLEGKSVTAEGAFRAVLERYDALLAAQRRAGAWPAPPGTTREDAAEQGSLHALAWRGLPPPYQAHLAATLAPYGALLWQWDKRSGEAARASGGGRALLGRAAAAWWGGEGSGALLGAGAGAGAGGGAARRPRARARRARQAHLPLPRHAQRRPLQRCSGLLGPGPAAGPGCHLGGLCLTPARSPDSKPSFYNATARKIKVQAPHSLGRQVLASATVPPWPTLPLPVSPCTTRKSCFLSGPLPHTLHSLVRASTCVTQVLHTTCPQARSSSAF